MQPTISFFVFLFLCAVDFVFIILRLHGEADVASHRPCWSLGLAGNGLYIAYRIDSLPGTVSGGQLPIRCLHIHLTWSFSCLRRLFHTYVDWSFPSFVVLTMLDRFGHLRSTTVVNNCHIRLHRPSRRLP